MDLIEYLKEGTNVRVESGGAWLVWMYEEWVVFYHPYGARKNRTLYRGGSIEDAVEAMRQS